MDANSVSDDDVALYFTRIGKGGVVPSDEELAYSMLKSKLGEDGDWFRKKIEDVHAKFGLASPSRIAHLAIRCFKSRDGKFFTGSPFSAVVDLCDAKNKDERTSFCDFVQNGLDGILQGVTDKYQLTKWHSSRYASQRNGDVYLMLMMAYRSEKMFEGVDVRGLAELIFGYSSHTDYAIKKMLSEGVRIGIAKLLSESYYSSRRLIEPIAASAYKSVNEQNFTIIQDVIDWKSANEYASAVMSEGYGNTPNGRAFHVLLYACRESQENQSFGYDLEQEVWSEENRPWDYDHIMPHSVIENMSSSPEKNACEWLKNSIGNLAPLPFSVNRSLSDSVRDASYPCSDKPKEAQHLCLNGEEVAAMWNNGVIDPLQFSQTTIRRFSRMYIRWYDDLNIGQLFDFRKVLEKEVPCYAPGAMPVLRRYSVMTNIKREQDSTFTFKHIVADNKEDSIIERELYKMFCSEESITLSCDFKGLSVAIVKRRDVGLRDGGCWEIGLRKLSDDSQIRNDIQCGVKKLFDECQIDGLNKTCICEDNTWWYWCEELPDHTEDLESELKTRIAELLRFVKMLP